MGSGKTGSPFDFLELTRAAALKDGHFLVLVFCAGLEGALPPLVLVQLPVNGRAQGVDL